MSEWSKAFEQSKPLITYAFISGLQIHTIASVFNEIRLGHDPSTMDYQQVVLDRVPRRDRPDYEFPGTAPIFLEGYNITKENQFPKAIPIVLTSTEAGRGYGIALMFYEDLKDYIRVVKEAISKFADEDDFYEEMPDEEAKYQFDQDLEERNRMGTITEDERESLCHNKFKLIEEYINNFTEEDLNKDGIFNGENYYIPKALFLLSRYPIFETLEQIVRYIYRECVNGLNFPLESYLSYLTHVAPLPPIGSEITYSLPNGTKFTVESKLLNELPAVPTNFYSEFFTKSILSTHNLFELLNWFMCQLGSTVFLSSNANKIVMSTEVLRSIIFPFDYDETYIPCLPSGLINYLEAPFPVLVGLVVTNKEQLEEAYEIASNKTLFVHLDENELWVKLSDQIISMKDFHRSSEISENGVKTNYANKTLPMKSKLDKLASNIETALKEYRESLMGKENPEEKRQLMVYEIRHSFLRYFVNLFKNYEKFIDDPGDQTIYDSDIREIFKEKEFINDSKTSRNSDFFADFFQTRLWIKFLEMK